MIHLSNLVLLLIAITLLNAISIGQFKPKPILVDEMNNADCETLWSRLDAFSNQLAQNTDASARIEIAGKLDEPVHTDFYWHNMIRDYARQRRITAERWEVRKLPRSTERRIRFWLVPRGVPAPESAEADWSFIYPADTRPFIFSHGSNYSVEVGVCLDVDEVDLLSQALAANPAARLNVVLITPTEKVFQRRKQKTGRKLTREYSIAKSRIRFFRKVGRPQPGYPNPDAEYWFVP
jgi:hypothetical protein